MANLHQTSRDWDRLWLGADLATMQDDGIGHVADGALAIRDGRIAWIGTVAQLNGLPGWAARDITPAQGLWITPGLIECHTHLVHAGDRSAEFDARLAGATYEEIARAGGGIVSTVRATRAANEAELLAQSLPRAQALLAEGVTTIEVKSGYGLDLASELKMLRVGRRLAEQLGITVVTRFSERMPCRRSSQVDKTTTCATCVRKCCQRSRRKVLPMRSMHFANALRSRKKRPRGSSDAHASSDCQCDCTLTNSAMERVEHLPPSSLH